MFIRILSFGRCNGSCNNVVNHLSEKVCPLSKTKVFNVITRINKPKAFNAIVIANQAVDHVTQIKFGRTKHANVNIKLFKLANSLIVGILVNVFLINLSF